jgi:hypothetical protein
MAEDRIVKVLTSYEEDGKKKRIVYSNGKTHCLESCTLVIEEELENTLGEKSFVPVGVKKFRIDGHTLTETHMLYRLLEKIVNVEN